MANVRRYEGKQPTLEEQALIIERAKHAVGVGSSLADRGFGVKRLPSDLFDWIKCRLDSTWYNGKRLFEPEWKNPASSVDDGQIIHESWFRSDGSIETEPRIVTWVNAYDPAYKDLLWTLLPLHEEWAGIPLAPTEAYGPRVYLAGSVLARHVDKPDTHIVASTITIETSTTEPWPFVIENHSGECYAIEAEAGEMVLFESSRLPHCRPEPLRAESYIGLFLHYKPRRAS
jgi:hypothetical protein